MIWGGCALITPQGRTEAACSLWVRARVAWALQPPPACTFARASEGSHAEHERTAHLTRHVSFPQDEDARIYRGQCPGLREKLWKPSPSPLKNLHVSSHIFNFSWGKFSGVSTQRLLANSLAIASPKPTGQAEVSCAAWTVPAVPGTWQQSRQWQRYSLVSSYSQYCFFFFIPHMTKVVLAACSENPNPEMECLVCHVFLWFSSDFDLNASLSVFFPMSSIERGVFLLSVKGASY